MDNKFYVSLEAEELLKEKGYPFVWRYDSIHPRKVTKAEVIDWLESKGIVITVDVYYIMHEEDDCCTSCWGYYIRKDDEVVCKDYSSDYKARLEAEEVAIIKALELL